VYQVPNPTVASAKAEKDEPKIGFYGTASYRLRGQIWGASEEKEIQTGVQMVPGTSTPMLDANGNTIPIMSKVTRNGSSFDYLNLIGWAVGMKAKVDDELSLQFQIGNDLNAGENVSWGNNNTPGTRKALGTKDIWGNSLQLLNNIYVHLAYATWNPGYFYLSGGKIPVVSNGTLDLLERSLNAGYYGESIFQTWAAQTNNALMALKLGVPIAESDDVTFGIELTASTIDINTQKLIGSDDRGVDTAVNSNPTSLLFIFDAPLVAGGFKLTPEFTAIFNRNYNTDAETGDHEILFGLSAGYQVSDGLSFGLHGGYGTISNSNSKIGKYHDFTRNSEKVLDGVPWDTYQLEYSSNGYLVGFGSAIKIGPGTLGVDFKFGGSWNSVTEYEVNTIDSLNGAPLYEDPAQTRPRYSVKTVKYSTAILPEIKDNRTDVLFDLRYTWNVHPKFSIAPRWRLFYSSYEEKSGHIDSKMENRPEIILTGTF
jgi:hypothetical protein